MQICTSPNFVETPIPAHHGVGVNDLWNCSKLLHSVKFLLDFGSLTYGKIVKGKQGMRLHPSVQFDSVLLSKIS